MNKKEVMMTFADVMSDLRKGNEVAINFIMGNTKFGGSNEDIDSAYDMCQRLLRHELLTMQHTYIKKEFDTSKEGLDAQLAGMNISPKSVSGVTKELYHANGIKFSKRQNADGTTTLLTDVLNELARAGVDKTTIENAVKKAEKTKKGNVYYIIEVDD